MTTYKPFNNLETQHESHQVNIDLSDNILPPITAFKTTLTFKRAMVLGCLQIICAVWAIMVGRIWWFSFMEGISGIVVILVGIYPSRINQILLFLSSIASFAVSIVFMISLRHWKEENIPRYVILIIAGLLECLISMSTFIMSSRDAGCLACVISPNTDVVYFKRKDFKRKKPNYVHGVTPEFPKSLKDTNNSLSTFTSIGSIFRSSRPSSNLLFGNDPQFGEVHYGPSPPPYLDSNSAMNVFDKNSNIIKSTDVK